MGKIWTYRNKVLRFGDTPRGAQRQAFVKPTAAITIRIVCIGCSDCTALALCIPLSLQ